MLGLKLNHVSKRGHSWQKVGLGLDKVFMPKSQQAITWINTDQSIDARMYYPVSMS